MIEETVGQYHRPEFQAPRANTVECAIFGEQLHHKGAEAADRAFLDRDQDFVVRREAEEEVLIEGFGEARVGDRRRDAIGGEILRRL